MSRISYLADLLASVFTRDDVGLEALDDASFVDLCDAILSHQGESSGFRLARSLLQKFDEATPEEQLDFFRLLAERFDINAEHTVRAAQHYAKSHDPSSLQILMESVEPRRQELFRRLNRLPGATNELVKMRALLLEACRQDSNLRRIDLDFQHLFESWFNQGFLVLREIDWQTPASILEKIIAYEAVHAINSWSALRQRVAPIDRRCFAFFHPAMLDEPLIFVEVALTTGSPVSIRQILKNERDITLETEAKTAVFYSISNCQKGLVGISLGNFLIKQVVQELSTSVPSLQQFRTLSPVPGFMRWVNLQLELLADENVSKEVDDTQVLVDIPIPWLKLAQEVSQSSAYEVGATESTQLQQLVAYYLTQVRLADMHAMDPVARFHLGNGASLDEVRAGADIYAKGLQQSAGVMVSYLYDLDKIATNHELYADERQILTSDAVNGLLEPRKKWKT